jgi:hypothetical protein
MAAGIDKTLSQMGAGFLQGMVTNTVTSTINSVTYSADGGWGFDSDGFGKSVMSGLAGSAVQAVQTATSGLINIGIEGLTGGALKDTSAMSNFLGGLAGQGVNVALGGDFTLNVLNFGFIGDTGNKTLNGFLSSGLLELHLGGEGGATMNIGTGGVNASIQNLVSVGQGMATYIDVNSRLAATKQEATKEFSSAMRTLYSGTEEQRRMFSDALDGTLLLKKSSEADFQDERDPEKRALAKTVDNEDGTRTMYIGTAALEDGSRFGLNVVFGHEAYRNGKDDGAEGQRLETDRAVVGHINTALELIAGYGEGSVGAEFEAEAREFDDARRNKDMAAMIAVLDQYDSSADYWRRVVREDGTYGVIRDGNHSLLDENGNILVRSPLDIFDEDGNITGQKIATENSYKRSFGMLMGLYPDFIQNGATYAEYDEYVDAALANGTDEMFRNGINEAMTHTAADGSIDVNAYLMTYADVIRGIGVSHIMSYSAEAYMTFVDIKNERGEVVGTVSTPIKLLEQQNEIDFIMVENMISEGRRLKAATFQIDSTGNVQMFGLGSTMPDPNLMGDKNPAIADGTYRQVTSLHDLNGLHGNPYKALRLFDAVAGVNAGWEDVTGPKQKGAAVPGFSYTETNNWGSYGQNLPGYYYDEAGNQMSATVSNINAHKSNNKPFTPSGSGNYGGSEGCQLWYPTVYDRILGNQQFKTFGSFTINRSLFGNGTGGKNDYRNW